MLYVTAIVQPFITYICTSQIMFSVISHFLVITLSKLKTKNRHFLHFQNCVDSMTIL